MFTGGVAAYLFKQREMRELELRSVSALASIYRTIGKRLRRKERTGGAHSRGLRPTTAPQQSQAEGRSEEPILSADNPAVQQYLVNSAFKGISFIVYTQCRSELLRPRNLTERGGKPQGGDAILRPCSSTNPSTCSSRLARTCGWSTDLSSGWPT